MGEASEVFVIARGMIIEYLLDSKQEEGEGGMREMRRERED